MPAPSRPLTKAGRGFALVLRRERSSGKVTCCPHVARPARRRSEARIQVPKGERGLRLSQGRTQHTRRRTHAKGNQKRDFESSNVIPGSNPVGMNSVLVSWGCCCNREPLTEWRKRQKSLSHSCGGCRFATEVWAGPRPSAGAGEGPAPGLAPASGRVVARGSSAPGLASCSLRPSPLLTKQQSRRLRGHPAPVRLIPASLATSSAPPSPNRVAF